MAFYGNNCLILACIILCCCITLNYSFHGRYTGLSKISQKYKSFSKTDHIPIALKMSSVDPSVGEDIEVLPPIDDVRKIVMKFGGSSLATAERVTYVAKVITQFPPRI